MQNTNMIEKIKLFLFNPFAIFILFVAMIASSILNNHSLTALFFMLIALYPIFWNLAYASWSMRVGWLLVSLILVSVIFG